MTQLVEKKKIGRPKSIAPTNGTTENEYVTFVLLSQNASYTLAGYTDKKGNKITYSEGKDKKGYDIPYKVTFNSTSRHLRIHKEKKKLIEFLGNAPQCKNSINANPAKKPIFKIYEPEKERKEGLIEKELAMRASKMAIELNSEELEKVSILIGMSPKGDISVTKEAVYDYAEKQPQNFLDIAKDLNSRDTEYKVFLAKCQDRGVINLSDIGYMFDDIKIGADKSETIRRISNDKELYAALQNKLNRLLTGIEA